MARGPVLNPVRAAGELEPKGKPLTREQRAIQRRTAKFEAQRAQEEAMAAGIQMQDLNPVDHQRKAVFVPKKHLDGRPRATEAPPAPPSTAPTPAPPVTPSRPRVVQRFKPNEETPLEQDILDLEASERRGTTPTESATPTAPSQPVTESPDADVDTILKRYKGSPEEVARQIAKSYRESETRMRRLEAERKLFPNGQPPSSPAPNSTPASPVPTHAPVAFDYNRFSTEILDKGADVAKDFAASILSNVQQEIAKAVGPVYGKVLENDLLQTYPDVVTRENLDIIKALAQNEAGDSLSDRLGKAVERYRTVVGTSPTPTEDVDQMASQVEGVQPRARVPGGQKKYRESEIRQTIQKKAKSGEWQRDPYWRNLVVSLYEEDRVIRGQ